jgi:hypothetical protein
VIPKVREDVPEAFTLVGRNHCGGDWAKDEDECEQRNAQAKKAVAEKACVALALERCRREVAREQKEKPHEVGLVGRDEECE